MDRLLIRTEEHSGETYVCVAGEIDLSNADLLSPTAILGEAGGSGRIHLDLTALRYMDSTGMHRIIQIHREAQTRGMDLVVHVQGGSLVLRVIRVVGADDLLRLEVTG